MIMQRNFRMVVFSQECGAFERNGTITEGGPLGTASDDADMLRHKRGRLYWSPYRRTPAASNKFKNCSFLSGGRNEASNELRASSRKCSSVNPKALCAS